MRISDLGEFGLIELVQQWLQTTSGPAVLSDGLPYRITVGNGDDAAAVTFGRAPVTELYTTDTMVDGIHFTSLTTPWRDLGWKSLASNISDVAAMGGYPAVALITLGLPSDTRVTDVKDLYAGMTEICGEFGVRIIGGDMVGSPVAFITVGLTGIASGAPMVRTAAEPDHLVAVTGPVGGSAGGSTSATHRQRGRRPERNGSGQAAPPPSSSRGGWQDTGGNRCRFGHGRQRRPVR